MKVLSFLGAVGLGVFAGSWLIPLKTRKTGHIPRFRTTRIRRSTRSARAPVLNINQASRQELVSVLGLDSETADRIVEHRPYPSKIDLLGRMIIPEEVYVAIKDRIAYKAV